mgnify:CR=1 FL=1
MHSRYGGDPKVEEVCAAAEDDVFTCDKSKAVAVEENVVDCVVDEAGFKIAVFVTAFTAVPSGLFELEGVIGFSYEDVGHCDGVYFVIEAGCNTFFPDFVFFTVFDIIVVGIAAGFSLDFTDEAVGSRGGQVGELLDGV